MKAFRLICLSACLFLFGCKEETLEDTAQAGDPQAQFQFALQIEKSRPDEARNYLTLAASKGVNEAQFKLGQMLTDGGMGFAVDKAKGLFWFEKAATGGHSDAKIRLAVAYAKGLGTRPNPAQALRWAELDSPKLDPEVAEVIGKALLDGTITYKDAAKGQLLLELAAKHGRSDALVALIKYLRSADPKGKNFAELLPRWKRAAELGNAEACETWGYYLYYGIGVPANMPEGVKFLEAAAAKDYELAIQTLYWAHNNPKLKERNPRQSFHHLQRIGGRGNGETCYLLARCYYFGQGVEKNDQKQLEFLRRGQALQDPQCMASLAWAYQWGSLGLTKNDDLAVSTYLRAARLGRHSCYDSAASILLNNKNDGYLRSVLLEAEKADAPDCHFWLGFLYHFGNEGIAKDEAKALELYEGAVAKGNNLAKTYLGVLLIEGKLVKKDLPRAITLIKEAALAGNMYAQFSYAFYLDQGTGTAQDSSMAYFWANLAAANGNNDAYVKKRDDLAKKIGPSETLRVQGLCREWLSSRKGAPNAPENPDRDTPAGGSGSGLIFTRDGHILTNHHVIAGGSQFKVITARGEEIAASLIASDEKLDVAVLKLASAYHSKDFPNPPKLASSSKVKSGEKVFTVGHPLGDLLSSEAKYNDGTISAMSGMGNDKHIMQISVPIQPGNSGGPLVNTRGEVVGLIVATVNGSALLREANILAQNINFAIKSDPIMAFLDEKNLTTKEGVTSDDPVEHVKAYAVKIISTP
jgi:TPR repeat protein